MAAPAHALPTEEEKPHEARLEKEGHQALEGERGAEDVADVMGEVGPIGAELELHGDAGGDPHGEIDAEERTPELGHLAPNGAPGHHIDAFHDGEQHGEPE